MSMVTRRLVLFSLLASGVCLAQSQFLLRVQQGSNVVQVPNGSTLSVSSPAPGTARTIQLLITYVGNTSVSFPEGATFLGSPDFSSPGGLQTSSLRPNQTTFVDVAFTPSGTAQALAQIEVAFTEAAPPPATPETPPGQPTRGRLTLALSGGVPVYSLQYVIGVTGNTIVLPPDGQLAFPDTVINTPTPSAIGILNRGAGTGAVSSITISGEAFGLANLPAVPAALPPAGSLIFQILYLPRRAGGDSGTLRINFEGGVAHTYRLTGRGISSSLSYEIVRPGSAGSAIQPGETIPFPQTSIGQSSKLQIRFTNVSSSDFTSTVLTTTGAPFALAEAPFLPLTLAPGASGSVSVVFSPTAPGQSTGAVRIGNDVFNLSGEALGPLLSYSYRPLPSSVSTAVEPLGLVALPAAAVGRSSAAEFVISNSGNAETVLNAIGVAAGSDVFKTSDLPPLPFLLQPQSSVSFRIQFLPNTSALASGTLRVDSASFTLTGSGEPAVPLSNYTIGGPSQAGPLEQPAVSLTLGQPYPIPLIGTLNLLVSSAYSVDPSVQFSTGGRTVNFTIPANSTRAVFPNASPEIQLQTGSVASTFTIVPAFTTAAGLSLTPESPSVLRFSMPESAPKILGLQVAERGSTTLTLRVLGVSTTRSLGKMEVRFTAAAGFNVPNLQFSLDLAGPSSVWFNSPASHTFGGQFTLDVQFQLATSDRGTEAVPPTLALESASVVISSPAGNSNSATVALR